MNAWLASDVRNNGAYIRAQAAWQLIGHPDVAGAVPEKQSGVSRRTALALGSSAVAASLAVADVVVAEGIVTVWNVAAPDNKIKLAAGQSALVSNEPRSQAEAREMTAEQINQKTAWRTGQIILGGETLGYAAAEFNRYNKDKIEIADSGLAAKTLVGGFQASGPQGFAAVVASLLHARVQKDGSTIILTR